MPATIKTWTQLNNQTDSVVVIGDNLMELDTPKARKLVSDALVAHNRKDAGISCEGGTYPSTDTPGKFERTMKVYTGL